MLIHAPRTAPDSAVAGVAMVVLAALDLGGALAAKEAVARRSLMLALLGAALFVVLFWVYASSLQYADLAPVTLGWIVVLQLGVLLIDRFHYAVHVPTGKWIAVGLILGAQVYLLLGPASRRAAPRGSHRRPARWRVRCPLTRMPTHRSTR